MALVTGTYDLAGITMCAAMQKVCHRSRRAARRAMDAHQARRFTGRMVVFRCPCCGQCHYGHPRPSREEFAPAAPLSTEKHP